jgi:hypothetical protein
LQVFYLNLVVRGEVRTLFETFCKAEPGKKLLTVREFLHFINNHQRDPRQEWPPNEYCTNISMFRIRIPKGYRVTDRGSGLGYRIP